MQDQIHNIQMCVFLALKRMMRVERYRDTALSWLGSIINRNEPRTSVTPQIFPVAPDDIQTTCSDGGLFVFFFAQTPKQPIERIFFPRECV